MKAPFVTCNLERHAIVGHNPSTFVEPAAPLARADWLPLRAAVL